MTEHSNLACETEDDKLRAAIADDLVVKCELVTSEEDGDEVEILAFSRKVQLFDEQYLMVATALDAETVAFELRDEVDLDDETLIRAFSFEATTDGDDDDEEDAFEEQRAHFENLVFDVIAERVTAFAATL